MAHATAHAETAGQAPAAAHETHQQHPIKLYLVVWIWLFVLSTCSYLVDYFHLQGMLRWSLIILFMLLKASFIFHNSANKGVNALSEMSAHHCITADTRLAEGRALRKLAQQRLNAALAQIDEALARG